MENTKKNTDTLETFSQEDNLFKPEDPYQISNLQNEIYTNLQEELEYVDETTEEYDKLDN